MLVVSNVGEVLMVDAMLNLGEDLTLKLYKNNYTPLATSVAGDFTVSDFTGYSNKTLTAGNWDVISSGGKAVGTYNSTQTFTCSGGSSQDAYGYYIVGATSGTLYWAERFPVTRTFSTGLSESLTVVLTGNSE